MTRVCSILYRKWWANRMVQGVKELVLEYRLRTNLDHRLQACLILKSVNCSSAERIECGISANVPRRCGA